MTAENTVGKRICRTTEEAYGILEQRYIDK